MYQSINHFSEFHNAFVECNRGNQFSREGFKLLFDYLEEYEESTGESIELDPIAICCDYVEDTIESIIQNYSIDVSSIDEYDREEIVLAWLQGRTTVVGDTGYNCIIYANF
jgi:hypothetical protein